MKHLDDHDVQTLVRPDDLVDALRSAWIQRANGDAAVMPRARLPHGDVMVSTMAAIVPPYMGGKIYTTVDGRFEFVIMLFDHDGKPLCTIDGSALSALRTAATCGLAIDLLGPPTIERVAIIGLGRVAPPHLDLLGSRLGDHVEIRIHARRSDVTAEFVERAVGLGMRALPASDPIEAVHAADVIITLTSSDKPLFPADAVSDRALICAMGATKQSRCEIDADVIERCALVVCDDLDASRIECGDLIAAAAVEKFDWARAADITDAVTGRITRPSRGPVLFESQGLALQDIAAAGEVWQRYTVTPKFR